VSPGFVSIAIAAIFFGLALPFLRRLLTWGFSQEPPGGLFLFCLLPAVQIYGLAVIDAPIAALLLGTAVEFVDDRRSHGWIRAGALLAASLFFTFGALWVLPVLAGFELVRRRRLSRTMATIALAAFILATLVPLFGFNWWRAFTTASALENDRGFLLFSDPAIYLWYRLGSVAEILFYFTPGLCLLAWRGWRELKNAAPDLYALAWLAPASLGLFLLSGAMRVGEAARIAMFVLPYLLLPVLAAWKGLDSPSRRRAARMTFAWGLLLQLFGFFQW